MNNNVTACLTFLAMRNLTNNLQQMGIVQQCAKDEVPTNESGEITEIQALKSELEQLKRENTFLKSKHDELSSKYQLSVLRLERVVASDVNFKFYTIYPNYATFKAFFNYLQSAWCAEKCARVIHGYS